MDCANLQQHLGAGWAPPQQAPNCTYQAAVSEIYTGVEIDPMNLTAYTNQRNSLRALSSNFSNAHELTDDWYRLNLPCGSPRWTGVLCSSAGMLTGFNFSNRGLSGALPGAALLAAIPSLEVLDLSYNAYSGAIPAALLSLTALKVLRLQRNMLTGALPDGINAQRLLEEQDLSDNAWTVGGRMGG